MHDAPDTRSIKTAEILAVGSELLTPFRLDTNSLVITERLNAIGIQVAGKTVVGDDRAQLAAVFAQALARSDLVLLTGGLGPTDDDLTREVVAEVLELPLEEDAAIVERIRRRFESRGWRMPEINRRQAQVPRGARVLENPNGTAPGLVIERDAKVIVLLPGPPREMCPLLERVLAETVAPRTAGRAVYRRVLKVTGRTESHVEEAAQPVYSKWLSALPPISTTILAAPGQIELHLAVEAQTAAEGVARLESAAAELTAALGSSLYSTDGRTLEQVVGDALRARGLRIAVAESCTGGLVTSRLTDVPGSSAYVELGIVGYSNDAKRALLGVPAELIETHGAVSEPVAMAMAEGARRHGSTHIGVGVTGVAGPSGGTDRKPVGMVSIAVAGPGERTRVRTFQFPGGREQIKQQASQAALDLIRRALGPE